MNAKKDKGFGLVEVLVAAGLLGAVSLGVMKLMENMTKAQKTVELRSHKNDVNTMLRLYLSNPKSCEATFGGLTTGVGVTTNVTKIVRFGDPTSKTVVDLGANVGVEYGQGASKISIKKMRLLDYEEITAPAAPVLGEGMARLEFTFEKSARKTDTTYGPEEFTESVFFSLYVDNTYKVVACMDSEGAAKAACESLGGVMVPDPVTSELICAGLDLEQANGKSLTARGLIEVTQPNNNNGLVLNNSAGNSSIYIKPNQISLSSTSNQTSMHIRSWGSAVDIESANGPLVMNNKAVTQVHWVQDTADSDGDGDTTEIIQQNIPNDGRMQVGGYAPADTNTLYVAGTVYATGNIRTDGSVTGTVFIPSDLGLKENIRPIENAILQLSKLRGVSYDWSPSSKRQGHATGLIAQEVQKVFPHLVRRQEDALSVDYIGLIPYMLEALKSQQREINQLKARMRP